MGQANGVDWRQVSALSSSKLSVEMLSSSRLSPRAPGIGHSPRGETSRSKWYQDRQRPFRPAAQPAPRGRSRLAEDVPKYFQRQAWCVILPRHYSREAFSCAPICAPEANF